MKEFWRLLIASQGSYKFQEDHGFDFWKQEPEKRREMFIRTLFATIAELGETGDEVTAHGGPPDRRRWCSRSVPDPASRGGRSLDRVRDAQLRTDSRRASPFRLGMAGSFHNRLLLLTAAGKHKEP